MKDEVQLIVRRPLAVLEGEIRKAHGISAPLADVSVDDTFITFVFSGSKTDSEAQGSAAEMNGSPDIVQRGRTPSEGRRRRRRKRKRVRIRTSGWEVVTKMTNSQGLRCNIYRPLYEALKGRKIGKREAAITVHDIIRKNGNPNPSAASVEYFLNNTLEYIAAQEAPS